MKNEAKHDMSGSKLTGREIAAYFKKNPKANKVYKAVVIALDHGGAMTYATKEIEKLKKGLSNHPEVKKALRWANESTHSTALEKFQAIVTENYTKNFELLCQSLKFNPIQQRILDNFIHKGQIKDQYVGRIAGTAKNSRIYAGTKKFIGSIENRKEALMKALKVNGKQKDILDSYLKTGRVVGKYAGLIAGSIKPTKSYAGFRGFKEHFETVILETTIKTSILANDDWDGSRDREENPKGLTLQQFITIEAKKLKIKVKFKNGAGNGYGGPDLAIFTGKDADLIKYFNQFYDARMKNSADLKRFGESLELEGKKFKSKFRKEAVNPTSYVSREGKKIIQKYKKEIKAANKAKSLADAFKKLGDKAYEAIGQMLMNDGTIKTDDPDEWDKEIGDWVSFVKV